MSKSKTNLCWVTFKAKDIKRGMYISKQLAKTPRCVEQVDISEKDGLMGIIVDGGWEYLLDISLDHPVDVLCYSGTHEPLIEEL